MPTPNGSPLGGHRPVQHKGRLVKRRGDVGIAPYNKTERLAVEIPLSPLTQGRQEYQREVHSSEQVHFLAEAL